MHGTATTTRWKDAKKPKIVVMDLNASLIPSVTFHRPNARKAPKIATAFLTKHSGVRGSLTKEDVRAARLVHSQWTGTFCVSAVKHL